MKDFSDVNSWVSSHVFNDLTTCTTRAVSRVTAARNDINRIESEYVSAYNSIQTLGYDSHGSIEDQTSADRLTIPKGVLHRYIALLSQYRNSLSVDRDQFLSELKNYTSFYPELGVTNVIDSSKQVVLNFGDVITVTVFRDGTDIAAKAFISKPIVDLFNKQLWANTLSAMPTLAYVDSQNKILTAIWTDKYIYPNPTAVITDAFTWRVIISKQSNGNFHCVVEFSNDEVSYNFHFSYGTTTSHGCIFHLTAQGMESITSEADLEAFLIRNQCQLSSNKGFVAYNPSEGRPFLYLYSSLGPSDLQIWNAVFAFSNTEMLNFGFGLKSPTALCASMFDIITSITPEDLDNLISLISNN